jgi:hypothetical protein
MPFAFSPVELVVLRGLIAIGLPVGLVWFGRRLSGGHGVASRAGRSTSDLEERVRRVEERVEDVADGVRRTEEGQRFVEDVLGARPPRDRTS